MNVCALTLFITASDTVRYNLIPEDKREESVISELARYFGPEAMKYQQFIVKDWSSDKWAMGAYSNVISPGSMTQIATAKDSRIPEGNVHFAGTEAALKWSGYMSGAVEAGYRAASEVINK